MSTHMWPAPGQPRSAWIALCDAIEDTLSEYGAAMTQKSNLSNIPAVYGTFDTQEDARAASQAVTETHGPGVRGIEDEGIKGWTVVVYPPNPARQCA